MADSTKPLHGRIASGLRARIRSGELKPGDAVPSEAQLCAAYGVSRGTVRQALSALRHEGLISGGRGRPPVVRAARLSQSFDELVSFTAWAHDLGREPGARTLELARRPVAGAAAEGLELEPGTPVFELLRLRTLDGRPVMVERTTFVAGGGRMLVDADIDGGSVYAQLGEQGFRLVEAEHTIDAIAAGVEDADLLGVPRRAPLLQVRRLTRDADGMPVEFSIDRFRGDAFAITVQNNQADRRAGVQLQAG